MVKHKTTTCSSGSNHRGRQVTLAELWKTAPAPEVVAVTPPLAASMAPPFRASPVTGIVCVDLFCGCGGWSTGAAQAGHAIGLAIDNDAAALRVHRRNHPSCTHVRMRLGPKTEDRLVALINEHCAGAAALHVHGSPPCQAFSAMRNVTGGRDVEAGMEMVEWYIDFVRRLKPKSWSFEQVCMPAIRQHLETHKVCYGEFAFKLYGVPQTRKRTLAGTPALVHALRDDPAHRVDTVVAASSALSSTMPRLARYVRASGGKKPPAASTIHHPDGTYTNADARWARSVDLPTWTVLCAAKPVWLDERFRTIRVFTRREVARLQTLPENFRIHNCDEMEAIRLIGNCVPPLIARKLMTSLKLASATPPS